MDCEEFSRVTKNGLGRANLWLREHPWEPYADSIAHVCLHNTAYDAQCEGSRAEYAHELVRLTNAPQHFAELTAKALLESKEYWDVHHLFHLARLFAAEGSALARAAMYEKCTRADGPEPFISVNQLIHLDGIEGLLFALDRIGQWLATHPDDCVDDELLREAREQLGDQVAATVAEAALTNPNIRRYVAAQEKWLLEHGGKIKVSDYRNWSYPELRQQIIDKQGDVPIGWLPGWGHHASDDSLRDAAADLHRQNNRKLLVAYLRIFARRDYPPLHPRLIVLAASNAPDVSTAACRALCNAQNDSIRPLVLKLVANGQADGDVIRMLARNYRSTDHSLIESLLKTQTNEDILHWQCHAAVEVFEANADADALQSMLQVYERCRCSICRYAAVKVLFKRGRNPTWLIEECLHDSYEDTRELAHKKLAG